MATVKNINNGTGQFTVLGNISASNIGNIQGGYFFGNGYYLTGVGNGGGGGGNYDNANVLSYMAVFPGNIIPTGNNQTLGNAANPWQTLYVSGNTIVIGTANLTTSGNTLFVNGNQVITSSSGNSVIGNLAVSGNILAGGYITTAGNITAGNLVANSTITANGIISSNANINTSNNVNATGNVTANNMIVTTSITTGGNIIGGNISANTNLVVGNFLTVNGGGFFSANVAIGNISDPGNARALSVVNVNTGFLYNPLGNAISLDGSQRISNVGLPTSSSDVATKAYVDQNSSGLQVKASCELATAAPISVLTATYADGGNISQPGVGATITSNTDTQLVVDGVVPTVGDRVLIKDEVGGEDYWNGIYEVTQVGASGVAPFILTRSTDMDIGTEFPNAYTLIKGGTTNDGTGWVCTNPSNPTPDIGTDAITFVEFTSSNTYTAGPGLSESLNVFSVYVDNVSLSINNVLGSQYLQVNPTGNITTGNIGVSGNITFPVGDPEGNVNNVNNFDAISAEIVNLRTTPPQSSIPIQGTGISGNGSVVTLTYAAQGNAPFTANNTIIVSGFDANVTGYDGTYSVISCNTTAVLYASTYTGNTVQLGSVQSPGTILGNVQIDAGGNITGVANTTVSSGAVNLGTLGFYSGYDIDNPSGPQPATVPPSQNPGNAWPGPPGAIRFDANYLYVCVSETGGAGTWNRISWSNANSAPW